MLYILTDVLCVLAFNLLVVCILLRKATRIRNARVMRISVDTPHRRGMFARLDTGVA